MKKVLILALLAFALSGCGNKEEDGVMVAQTTAKPVATLAPTDVKYETVKERLDESGMLYITIATASTTEAELKTIVDEATRLSTNRSEPVDSVFIFTILKDSESKAYTSTGKTAITRRGTGQTGLTKINDTEFKFIGI